MNMRGFLGALALVGGIAASSASHAETIGYGEAIRTLTSACGNDLETYCKGVKPGQGAIRNCLVSNQISPNCAATVEVVFPLLQARAAAQEAAPKLCANDARRRCSDFREGNARVLRCLIRPDINKGVSKQCRQALIDAGWGYSPSP